jgi:hypothetical protein
MADTSYKPFELNDRVVTRTLLHEAIPLTGTIVSGTYGDNNIKNYSHGMFQSVYDYPYLSSSANHIFDITVGVSANSGLYSSVTSQKSKKKNIYNQMAQLLMGYDTNGQILRFDEDGDILSGGNKIDDAIFINFARLLTKDEIKKESFEMKLGTALDNDGDNQFGAITTVSDVSASTEYRVNSPAGEYAILYATGNIDATDIAATDATKILTIGSDKYVKCGLLYYQAGIAILTSSLFQTTSSTSGQDGYLDEGSTDVEWLSGSTSVDIEAAFKSNEISASADALRLRIQNIQFNNTTELNSTVYFCRANHNEFNYSSNPTYLSSSKLVVKNTTTDNPVSYITSVGLYNDNRELLAVAKLSEPLKKTPDTEFTLRVRLDY